jgi:hypothetical protein
LKYTKPAKPSNATKTRVDVEDVKTPLVKKHSKPPKAIRNVNTLKIGTTLPIRADLV